LSRLEAEIMRHKVANAPARDGCCGTDGCVADYQVVPTFTTKRDQIERTIAAYDRTVFAYDRRQYSPGRRVLSISNLNEHCGYSEREIMRRTSKERR
jgi:hypothetical protein